MRWQLFKIVGMHESFYEAAVQQGFPLHGIIAKYFISPVPQDLGFLRLAIKDVNHGRHVVNYFADQVVAIKRLWAYLALGRCDVLNHSAACCPVTFSIRNNAIDRIWNMGGEKN